MATIPVITPPRALVRFNCFRYALPGVFAKADANATEAAQMKKIPAEASILMSLLIVIFIAFSFGAFAEYYYNTAMLTAPLHAPGIIRSDGLGWEYVQ